MAKKKSGPKIVMVGGGSYNWCPRLMRDLILTDELEGSEVVLLDPNLKAAEEVKAASEAMCKRFGKQFKVVATKSETTAFRQADFVIITISTGGLDAMAHDLKIPEKYGIFHTVGDTVGPGGWSRSLRNVPVFVRLAQKIEKLSPRAVILNYTNPLSVLTGVLHEVSNLRSVGLCHGVFGTYRLLQNIFKCEESDLAIRFGGVNHFFWIVDFTVRGKDGYPALKRKLRGRPLWQATAVGPDEAGHSSGLELCNEFYNEYGFLTYAGDRHTSEFLPGYLTPTAKDLKKFKLVRTSVKQRRAAHKRGRKHTQDLARGKADPGPRWRETAVDIMMALAHGKAFVDVVNLPNEGQIDNLPRDAVVETLGLVDPLGFRPVAIGEMPWVLEQMLTPHCNCQLMTLDAALMGDKDLAFDALMTDPICSHLSPSQIRKMGTELMAATKKWLPQF